MSFITGAFKPLRIGCTGGLRIFVLILALCVFPGAAASEPALLSSAEEQTLFKEGEISEHELRDLLSDPALSQSEPTLPNDRVSLNAERVSYNDETGMASAQGDAVLLYRDTMIRAERIEYDAETQKVDAMPFPGKQVTLSQGGRTLRGDRLNYDLTTNEGTLTGSGTNIPLDDGVLYVNGEEIDVMPWALAVERGLVSPEHKNPTDYMVEWRKVKLTTCALDHPHYRLEAKKMTFIPGKMVVAKRPRIYLGSTYIMTSPLDYVVNLKHRAIKYSFIPYIQHEEGDDRGIGGGLSGTIGWETGSLSTGFAWSRRGGPELHFEVEQSLSSQFSVLAGVNYTWDSIWDETIWRPYASLIFADGGWDARVNWSQKESYSEQKNALYKYNGRINREPEFIVTSPWFKTSKFSWLTLAAAWGSYSERTAKVETDSTQRYGTGLRSYIEIPLGDKQNGDPLGGVELFSHIFGRVWFYDRDDADQEMLRSFTGLRYNLGVFEMGTAYERMYVWGESAMLWDQYYDAERVHQRLRFPLGREIYALFRGSYDLNESMIDEMTYSLQWLTDCMKWDLHYTDDRTSGNDDTIGLTMSILAFPNTPASFGQRMKTDLFDRPNNLPKE